MALRVARHYTELVRLARHAEQEGEAEKAIELYELAVRQKPVEALPYQRLMILYRKFKQPKEELKVVSRALAVFLDHYEEKKGKVLKDPAVARASKALFHALNGKKTMTPSWYPEPIPKWTKRKEALEKKLSKQS
jgi:tetratricopeptide (TPR) repeat protein